MDNKTPSISEKVKFWEEQDKINNALIPRFLADHNLIMSVSQEMIKFSSDLSQTILDCKELDHQVIVNNEIITSISQEITSLSSDLAETKSECIELGKQIIEMNSLLANLITKPLKKKESTSNNILLYILVGVSILLSTVALLASII